MRFTKTSAATIASLILAFTAALSCGEDKKEVELPNGETDECELDEDCDEILGELDQCRTGVCLAGECVVEDLDGVPCDDGDPCTESMCEAGVCESAPIPDCIACSTVADCEPHDDGDPCTGVLECIDGSCQIDPDSIPCGSTNDTDCRMNTCDPTDLSCSMENINEGGTCDGDPAVTCETSWGCSKGRCICECDSTGGCAAGHTCIAGACVLEQGSPCADEPVVTDIDANKYRTVQIGTQCWMAENMRTVTFADGTPIAHVVEPAEWEALEVTEKAYSYYNNNTGGEGEIFGALYTWAAAMNGASSSNASPSGVQGICPDGWHLPSDEEWTALEEHLVANGYNYDETTVENKIAKSLSAAVLWSFNPNEGVVGNDLTLNNRSGFTALPGGHRDGTGSFPHFGNHSRFWTATEENPNTSKTRIISFNRMDLYRDNFNKRNGGYVRCVRD